MNTRVKWIIAAAATTILAGPATANHQWGSYHWARSANPLTLDVLRQIGSQWESAYSSAIGDWDAPKTSVLDLNAASSNAGVSAKKCNAINGKVLVCADSYGFRGWLGIATIWANGDHIYQGTTQLNDSYFNTSTYNKPEWRNLVTCQEIGHDFGLAHQDETFDNANLGSCMDYTNEPLGGGAYGPNNEHPNAHDYELLEDMYAHLDSSDGGGGGGGADCNPRSPKCSGQDAFNFREVGTPLASAGDDVSNRAGLGPSEWGQAIATDAQGRPNVYRMDLGNGRKKITHVFWAIGEGPRRPHH